MSQATTVNALAAAVELGVSYKTVLRWARIGGSEIISGAQRVGKEWEIPISEIQRIKERRQLTYARIRDTDDYAALVSRLYQEMGADVYAGLLAAAEDFVSGRGVVLTQPLLEAVDEYRAWVSMKVVIDNARTLSREAHSS